MALITAIDLEQARADAEGEMRDTCDIHSDPDARTEVFDEETGLYTAEPGTLIYSGICKRQVQGARFEQRAAAGEHVFTESRLQLHLPIHAPRIPAGSIATITSSWADPTAVGQKLRINAPGGKTLSTAHRMNVSEVVD